MAALATIATLGLNIFSSQQQARAQSQQNLAQFAANDANAKAQIATLQRTGAIEEQRRRDLLEKETAARRARFAGRGLASSDGSAAAVLGGLAEESKLANREDAFLRNERIRELEAVRLSRGRIDLLQAADARARGRLRTLQRGIPLLQKAGTSLFDR
ncbi:MAG: hypothetical protein COA65_06315 [Rhodospirillaceae bacterium]|nr:MAG: hypothetical protein COA65_06315 [Rhodospirillaceae bacterium]